MATRRRGNTQQTLMLAVDAKKFKKDYSEIFKDVIKKGNNLFKNIKIKFDTQTTQKEFKRLKNYMDKVTKGPGGKGLHIKFNTQSMIRETKRLKNYVDKSTRNVKFSFDTQSLNKESKRLKDKVKKAVGNVPFSAGQPRVGGQRSGGNTTSGLAGWGVAAGLYSLHQGRLGAGVTNFGSLGTLGKGGVIGGTAYLAGRGAYEFTKFIEPVQNLEKRFSFLTKNTEELSNTMKTLRQIADRTGTSIEGTGLLYQRSLQALQGQPQALQNATLFTRVIANAIKASGATTEEQKSLAIQASQAIGAGELRGQELRAVAEASPILANLLTQAAKKAGFTSIYGERGAGQAGYFTTARLVEIFEGADLQIKSLADKFGDNVTQAQNRFVNSMKMLGVSFDNMVNVSGLVIGTFNTLAKGGNFLSDAMNEAKTETDKEAESTSSLIKEIDKLVTWIRTGVHPMQQGKNVGPGVVPGYVGNKTPVTTTMPNLAVANATEQYIKGLLSQMQSRQGISDIDTVRTYRRGTYNEMLRLSELEGHKTIIDALQGGSKDLMELLAGMIKDSVDSIKRDEQRRVNKVLSDIRYNKMMEELDESIRTSAYNYLQRMRQSFLSNRETNRARGIQGSLQRSEQLAFGGVHITERDRRLFDALTPTQRKNIVDHVVNILEDGQEDLQGIVFDSLEDMLIGLKENMPELYQHIIQQIRGITLKPGQTDIVNNTDFLRKIQNFTSGGSLSQRSRIWNVSDRAKFNNLLKGTQYQGMSLSDIEGMSDSQERSAILSAGQHITQERQQQIEDSLQRQRQYAQALGDAFANAAGQGAAAFGEMLFNTEKGLERLKNTAFNLFADITNQLVKRHVTDPLAERIAISVAGSIARKNGSGVPTDAITGIDDAGNMLPLTQNNNTYVMDLPGTRSALEQTSNMQRTQINEQDQQNEEMTYI